MVGPFRSRCSSSQSIITEERKCTGLPPPNLSIALSNAPAICYQSHPTVVRFVQVFRVSEAVTEERKRAGLPPPAWVRRLNAPAAWAEVASDRTAAVANVSAHWTVIWIVTC